jgi:hypothetical protein
MTKKLADGERVQAAGRRRLMLLIATGTEPSA